MISLRKKTRVIWQTETTEIKEDLALVVRTIRISWIEVIKASDREVQWRKAGVEAEAEVRVMKETKRDIGKEEGVWAEKWKNTREGAEVNHSVAGVEAKVKDQKLKRSQAKEVTTVLVLNKYNQ